MINFQSGVELVIAGSTKSVNVEWSKTKQKGVRRQPHILLKRQQEKDKGPAVHADAFQQVRIRKGTRINIFDDLRHLTKEQREATKLQDLRRCIIELHNGKWDPQGGKNSRDGRGEHASTWGLATSMDTREQEGRKASATPQTSTLEFTTSRCRSELTAHI